MTVCFSALDRIGYTDDKQPFVVPPTSNAALTFLDPRNWSLPTIFTLV